MASLLFMLAGYPAVGKSTVLTSALRNRLALFGPKHDALFQSTRIPPRFPEWTLTAEELLAHGSWFSERDVPYLATQRQLPSHLVLHIDLASLASPDPKSPRCPPEVSALLPRTGRSLVDVAEHEAIYRYALSDPFYARFDHVVVNTLYAPWETIAKQWQDRQVHLQTKVPGREPLFNFARPRPDIHKAMYTGWLRAIRVLNPELALYSEMKAGALTMRQVFARPAPLRS